MRNKAIVLALAFACWSCSKLVAQRSVPPQEQLLNALQSVMDGENWDAAAAAKLVAETNSDELVAQLRQLREEIGGAEAADIMIQGPSIEVVFEHPAGPLTVQLQITRGADPRIKQIDIRKEAPNNRALELSWDNVEAQFDRLAEAGFEGAILLMREGKPVFEKGYGLANREQKIPIDENTVFAIGSCPIDFTHAGILLLKDQGKLALNDPITKYFKTVPNDKQAITIQHLMSGQSGLKDFHDLPSDENADHSWIDRDEAVRRIFAQELLFEPGSDRRHSHSAWGLLAAIIEIVSGESYPEFARERLFKPAGMNDTGFFGESVDEDRIAVGYGHKQSSEPNSPPHWGPTSWLVMGSGGQVSTLRDIARWEIAIRKGKILSPESTKEMVGMGDALASDGDMFGFEFMHSKNPESMFLLISNSIDSREKRRRFDQLGRALYQLVRGSSQSSKYSLGVAMAISSDGGVVVRKAVPGGAAAEAGLQAGDALVSANGQDLDKDPLAVLGPMIDSGQEIVFGVLRDDEQLEIRVTPHKK